jgi:hypothetical protein
MSRYALDDAVTSSARPTPLDLSGQEAIDVVANPEILDNDPDYVHAAQPPLRQTGSSFIEAQTQTPTIGESKYARLRHSRRENFDRRGSLVMRMKENTVYDPSIRSQSRTAPTLMVPKAIKPKTTKLPKALLKTVDVYIPTTVPVGQLAKLLNVRLGELFFLPPAALADPFVSSSTERLQQVMKQAGMAKESSYDYGEHRPFPFFGHRLTRK